MKERRRKCEVKRNEGWMGGKGRFFFGHPTTHPPLHFTTTPWLKEKGRGGVNERRWG